MHPQLMSFRPIAAAGTLVASALFATSTITIESGDSLSEIAERHGVTVDQLVEWNDLANPDRIVSGRTLIISAPDTTPAVTSTATHHVVTAGDTLSALASRFGTTIAQLATANDLSNPDRIIIGQRLTVGTTPPTTTTTAAPLRTHTVAPGDSLSEIAEQYGVKTGRLAAANGISNPDRIRIGMVLTIPAAEVSTAAPTPTTAAPTTPTTPTPTTTAAPTPTVPAPATPAPTSSRTGGEVLLVPMFANWSNVYGVPQDLLEAIAWQRSNWQPNTVGPDGHLGITQLSPATVELVENGLLGRDLDPLAAQDGIQMAARYLRYLIDRAGSEEAAVAAWVQGLTSVQTSGISATGAAFRDAVEQIREQRR